ncbi:MAG: phosphoribosyl-ATP diphosphatase [Bacillota bacterium]|nr:phosphoribosyl-ATP diphosphatase [Bacillota bacterium]
MDTLEKLYKVIDERKENPQEGSYTCYLFEQGLDKILKKIGEECSETIIAAKNGKKDDTVGEICDLMYHLLVMMSAQGITYSDVSEVLENRSLKIGNLKTMKKTDKLT